MNDDRKAEKSTTAERDDATGLSRDEWLRLVEEVHERMLRDLTVRLGRHDAQDVLQEFYLRILRYRPRLEGEASTRSFLNRIVRSVVADHFRHRATQEKLANAIMDALDAPVAVNAVDRVVCDCLRGLLPSLPPQYATLIQRIDLAEESRSAVAATLGITVQNLAVRLTRARAMLRNRLLAFCTSCPIHGFNDCRCPQSPAQSASQ